MALKPAKLIAKYAKKYGKPIGWKAATLTKFTAGAYGSTVTAGRALTPVPYSCTARIADYTASLIDGTDIIQGDRLVSILGATLPSGIAPAPTDKVTITDATGVSATYAIVPKGVRDESGIGVIYDCQVRR